MAKRRPRYGEFKHDATKVWRANMANQSLRAFREMSIKVSFHRMGSGFEARACIPKGDMNIRGGKAVLSRLYTRCGVFKGSSPTRALRGALAKLTRVTR
jgi:hypothetical protein